MGAENLTHPPGFDNPDRPACNACKEWINTYIRKDRLIMYEKEVNDERTIKKQQERRKKDNKYKGWIKSSGNSSIVLK
jgi:hypothetical protein